MQFIVHNALHNILHSREASILIAPPLLVSILKRYLSYARQKMRQLLLKNYLNTLDIVAVKQIWQSPRTWRNKAMFERQFVDFKRMLVLFARVRSKVLSVSMVLMCDVMELTGCDVIVDGTGWGSPLSRFEMIFMPEMSTSIQVVFCRFPN